jgi:hypothetical protein
VRILAKVVTVVPLPQTLVSGNDLKATKLAILIMHDLADDTY